MDLRGLLNTKRRLSEQDEISDEARKRVRDEWHDWHEVNRNCFAGEYPDFDPFLDYNSYQQEGDVANDTYGCVNHVVNDDDHSQDGHIADNGYSCLDLSVNNDTHQQEGDLNDQSYNALQSRAFSEASKINDDSQEICLGVITVKAVCTQKGSTAQRKVPVNITVNGDILQMKCSKTDHYVGMISNSTLNRLLQACYVRFDANLLRSDAPISHDSKQSPRTAPSQSVQNTHVARIIVYGMLREQQKIGDILSEDDIFLQHPSVSECDPAFEYLNPHFLVRPGSEMPTLEELSLDDHQESHSKAVTMDDITKSKVMQVFEEAAFLTVRPSILQSSRLKTTLKSYQLVALEFMTEKEHGCIDVTKAAFPQLWKQIQSSKSVAKYRHAITGLTFDQPPIMQGGILADEMGTGKTLTILSLICSSLDATHMFEKDFGHDFPTQTLVVAPKSTIPHWLKDVQKHFHEGKLQAFCYYGSSRSKISDALTKSHVVLTTYETMRSDFVTNGYLFSKKWYRLVLDEAHQIRNRTSSVFQAATNLSSQYRWCLTGTPIHNSIDDFGALITFLRVSPLAEKAKFDQWIASPLKSDKPNCFQNLKLLVRATCLRRTKALLDDFVKLPLCIEKTESVQLSSEDQMLYDFFKKETQCIAQTCGRFGAHHGGGEKTKGGDVVSYIGYLRSICNHGMNLLPAKAISVWQARSRTRRSMLLEGSDTRPYGICERCASKGSCDSITTADLESLECCECSPKSDFLDIPGQHNASISLQSGKPLVSQVHCSKRVPSPSAKVELLMKNLQFEQAVELRQDAQKVVKSVIFSYWTRMLDLIEQSLRSQNFVFQRIDGSTTLEGRRNALHQFESDPQCTIMLATIGSVGEGVSFVTATRVHLVEPQWNPMVEAQAIARVHRIGQQHKVTVIRYIVDNSIEEYVQLVQKQKLDLINRSMGAEDTPQEDIESERWKQLKVLLDIAYRI